MAAPVSAPRVIIDETKGSALTAEPSNLAIARSGTVP